MKDDLEDDDSFFNISRKRKMVFLTDDEDEVAEKPIIKKIEEKSDTLELQKTIDTKENERKSNDSPIVIDSSSESTDVKVVEKNVIEIKDYESDASDDSILALLDEKEDNDTGFSFLDQVTRQVDDSIQVTIQLELCKKKCVNFHGEREFVLPYAEPFFKMFQKIKKLNPQATYKLIYKNCAILSTSSAKSLGILESAKFYVHDRSCDTSKEEEIVESPQVKPTVVEEPEDFINIKVRIDRNNEQLFKVSKSSKVSSLMEAICKNNACSKVHLNFDGQKLDSDDDFQDLEDEDIIEGKLIVSCDLFNVTDTPAVEHSLMKFILCVLAFVASTFALYEEGEGVKILTDANFQSLVLKSPGIFLVEFYAPWCGHCKSLAPEYKKAAKKLKGLAPIGAIDCTVNQNTCGQYDVKGYPTIKLFKMDTKSNKIKKFPVEYTGGRTADSIVSYIESNLQSFVKTLGDKKEKKLVDFNTFININKKDANGIQYRVVLFSEKDSIPPLYKSLSSTFYRKLFFGFVKSSQSETVAKYNVESFPTLMVVEPGSDKSPVIYSGELKLDKIKEFLTPFAAKGGAKPESKENLEL